MKQFKDWIFNKELNKVQFVYEDIDVPVQPNLCDVCGKEFPIEQLVIMYEDKSDKSIEGSLMVCPKCFSKRCYS